MRPGKWCSACLWHHLQGSEVRQSFKSLCRLTFGDFFPPCSSVLLCGCSHGFTTSFVIHVTSSSPRSDHFLWPLEEHALIICRLQVHYIQLPLETDFCSFVRHNSACGFWTAPRNCVLSTHYAVNFTQQNLVYFFLPASLCLFVFSHFLLANSQALVVLNPFSVAQ